MFSYKFKARLQVKPIANRNVEQGRPGMREGDPRVPTYDAMPRRLNAGGLGRDVVWGTGA